MSASLTFRTNLCLEMIAYRKLIVKIIIFFNKYNIFLVIFMAN